MPEKKIHLIMVILLLFQIINALYWGIQKEGYYIDELWSYGLSNSYYEPFLQDKDGYMGQWHEPSFYKDYLTVRKEEAFSYGSVYDNQTKDVHPPLYYMLLHSICSLFPGTFSKWYGLTLNYVFFCGCIWLVYLLSGFFPGRESRARLIPPLVYGISGGALSTAMYIRMYMLLTFWVLLVTLLSFIFLEKGKKQTAILAGITIATIAGFLTQYYFLVFAFFLSAGCICSLLLQGRLKKAALYAASVLAGILSGTLLFPAAVSHIFLGQKGKDSFSNVFLNFKTFFHRLTQYLSITSVEFFGIPSGIYLLFACLFLLKILCLYKKAKNPMTANWWILFTAALGYFCVITQISTDLVDRYQFAVYPAFCLAITGMAVNLLRQLEKGKFIWVLTACYLLVSLFGYHHGSVHYIEKGYQTALSAIRSNYQNSPGVYVTPGDHLVINDCLFLMQQNKTIPITEKQINELPELCGKIPSGNLVLYVNIYYDGPRIAHQAAKLLGFPSVRLLYDNTYTQIYILDKAA